jgi:hypothetical protein
MVIAGYYCKPLCRTRLQVLGFYFSVPVSSQLCLEVDLIHLIFPPPSAPALLFLAGWRLLGQGFRFRRGCQALGARRDLFP